MSEMKFGDLSDDETPVGEIEISEEAVWESLQEETNKDVEDDIAYWTVPRRTNIKVGFNCSIDYDTVKSYFKSATTGSGKKRTMDPLRLAFIVLSNKTVGIKLVDRQVTKDGVDVTLASRQFWSGMMKQPNTQDGMRRLFGSEGDIISMSQEVLTRAGYGDTDFEEDDELDVPR